MKTLYVAIYLEGQSDVEVMPMLVQRIAQQMLNEWGWAERGWDNADVEMPFVLNTIPTKVPPDLPSRLLAAARNAYNYHLLIIHRDADAPTTEKARKKIAPALRRVEQAKIDGEAVCATIILVVPIREMEAWLLADADAIRKALGLEADTDCPGVPKHAHEVEAILDPKQRLNQVVATHAPGIELNEIYEELTEAIRLDRLRQLHACEEFEKELKAALTALEIIAPAASNTRD